jgi:hypothetical protein
MIRRSSVGRLKRCCSSISPKAASEDKGGDGSRVQKCAGEAPRSIGREKTEGKGKEKMRERERERERERARVGGGGGGGWDGVDGGGRRR